MSENADKYRRAVGGFDKIVSQVSDWSASSPCEKWQARDVIGHVIGGTQMISTVETGQEPNYDPASAAGDDPAKSWAAARDQVLGVLTDENLSKTVQSPLGEMPLDNLIGMILVNDVLIHTWDLAKAAGTDVTLDPDLCEQAYNGLQPMDAMVRSESIFGPKIDPPEGADIQTKLLCFVGRQA